MSPRLKESLLWAAGAAGASLLLAAIALTVWQADFTVPLDVGGGDTTLTLISAKGMFDNGWFLINDHLGAPFHLDLRDFPAHTVWSLHFAGVKLLGLFTSDPVVAVNLYFLLTFPLAAVAAFLFMRRMEVSAPSAAVCAVLFALLPYHFGRGEAHLGLAGYFVVPAGAYLAVAILSRWPLFARRRAGPGWLSWASGTTLVTIALCILVATADIYYSAITLVLVVFAAAVRSIGERRLRPVGVAALVALAIGVTFVALISTTIVYRLDNGPNPEEVAVRHPYESEIYATTLTRMILPADGNPVGFIDDIVDGYYENSPIRGDAGGAQLGVVATVGFLLLLALPLLALLGPERLPALLADRRMRLASGATLILLLLATAGGLSALIANLITAQLRSWQRVTIFVGLFALLAVALLLDWIRLALAPRRYGRGLFVALVTLVLAFAFFDQTGPYFAPDYGSATEARDSRAALVDRVERLIPGGEVLQLPAESFPEWIDPGSPRLPYDSALPYLDSSNLRWSYGAIRGRPEDWLGADPWAPPGALATAAAAAGFDGVWIDRYAYGDPADRVESRIARLAGASPISSDDGRYSFLPLGGLRRRLRAVLTTNGWPHAQDAALHPPVPTWAEGFEPEEVTTDGRFHWASGEATLEIDNPLESERRLRLVARVEAPEGPLALGLKLPGGGHRTYEATPAGTPLTATFVAPPGESEIVFSSDLPQGADAEDPEFRLLNPVLMEPRWLALGRRLGGGSG